MIVGACHREARIDVIVRTGGRPAALLQRAVRALARQTAGSIRVLLVRHGPADAEALRGLVGGALQAIQVIDAPGANRGRALAAGLAQVTAPRFALLDDDDDLLEDHFAHLLRAADSVAAPAFAYADILVSDEGAGARGQLALWRQGPAQPPLGRITDRISAHAFLADRAALDGLPFAHWDLATAEDALLVASLLARSTPVHSPHATCVYVQGRGDASAYLAHPQRAADELAFAREIAPHRAAIEARFGAAEELDEAAYLAPFIAAARHAEVFAQLRSRSASEGVIALRDDTIATPVAGDVGLAAVAFPLVFEPVAEGAGVWGSEAVTIEADRDFAYAARAAVHLPSPARPAIVAVRVTQAEGAFGVGLAGPDHALVVEAKVDPAPIPLEIQLPWNRPEPPTLIVRRLDARGVARPHIRIGAATLAFPCETLAPGGDRGAAQAALAALARANRAILSPALPMAPGGGGDRLPGVGPISVALGEAPWAYAWSVPLRPEAREAALRFELGAAASAVFVLRVDADWAPVGERLEAPAGASPATLWLEPLPGRGAARLVVQAGPAPAGGDVTLHGVFLYPVGAAP